MKMGVHYQKFKSTRPEELSILTFVIQREAVLKKTIKCLCDLDNNDKVKTMEHLIECRDSSLRVIEEIAKWRSLLVKPLPYMWNGKNYVLKIASDMDFIFKSKKVMDAFGIKLPRRNPFFTVAGLDRILDKRNTFESWHYYPDKNSKMSARIRKAEDLILCEEKLHKIPKSDFKSSLATIVRAEEEYTSRMLRLQR